jgi:hypothetical protein
MTAAPEINNEARSKRKRRSRLKAAAPDLKFAVRQRMTGARHARL